MNLLTWHWWQIDLLFLVPCLVGIGVLEWMRRRLRKATLGLLRDAGVNVPGMSRLTQRQLMAVIAELHRDRGKDG